MKLTFGAPLLSSLTSKTSFVALNQYQTLNKKTVQSGQVLKKKLLQTKCHSSSNKFLKEQGFPY